MISTSSLLLLILPSLSEAVTYQNYVVYDAGGAAPSDGYATYRAADTNANATHSVSFSHFPSADNTSTVSRNWTWTLKTTDVHLSNISSTDLDTLQPNTPDAHVAYTSYDFSWPESGNINQAIAAENNASDSFSTPFPSCFYLLMVDFPKNVSDRWDSSSPDCTSAIGEDCVQAILTGLTSSGGVCSSQNFPLGKPAFRDACASSFGANTGGGYGVKGLTFGNASAPANASALENGGTFAWALGAPFAPGNTTAFEIEEGKLRMVLLTGQGQRQLLCNRVSVTSAAARGTGVGLWAVTAVAVVAAFVKCT